MRKQDQPQIQYQQDTDSIHIANNFIHLREIQPPNNIPQIILEKMIDKEGQKSVSISSTKWKQYQMPKYCQYIDQWHVQKLHIAGNQHQQIIKDIENISFLSLKSINLNYNGIVSIEVFCRINMPNIEKIFFHNNKINSLKSLRKCRMEKIKEFEISKNQIFEWKSVTEFNMREKEEQKIEISLLQMFVIHERSFFKIQPKRAHLFDYFMGKNNVKQMKNKRFFY